MENFRMILMENFDILWTICKREFGIQQKPEEYVELLDLMIKHSVKKVLEIGCYSGGTTRGFLEITDSVISIDGCKQGQINALEEQYPDKYRFSLRNSHDVSTKDWIKSIVDAEGQFDFLFIDGDHSAEGSMQDFNMYREFVKPGGIIAFHDIVDSVDHHRQGCYVDVTWNEIKEKFNGEEIVRVDRDWAGIGYIFNA